MPSRKWGLHQFPTHHVIPEVARLVVTWLLYQHVWENPSEYKRLMIHFFFNISGPYPPG